MSTILVLDEEADSCMLLKRVLQRGGHDVITCPEHGRAVELVTSRQFDLVIANLQSGRKGSVELPDLLKAANSRLRVLVLTDLPSKGAPHLSSADDFLVKPVDLETIESKVREFLSCPERGNHSDPTEEPTK